VERVNLTTPIRELHISRLRLDWDNAIIAIAVGDANGALQHFTYEGDIARALMVALNKTDLSLKSLQHRVLDRLVADGKLVGTVIGTPD